MADGRRMDLIEELSVSVCPQSCRTQSWEEIPGPALGQLQVEPGGEIPL